MKLDISNYTVTGKKWELQGTERVLVDFPQTVETAEELQAILRINGIYQNLTETVDAILLAKSIKEHKAERFIEISADELKLIKKAIDVLLKKATENPQMQFGGIIYEELFIRIVSLGK